MVIAGGALLGTDVALVRSIAGFSAPGLSAVPALLGGSVTVALVGLAQAASIGPSLRNPEGSVRRPTATSPRRAWRTCPATSPAPALGRFSPLYRGGGLGRGTHPLGGGRLGVLLAVVVSVCAPLAERILMPVIGRLVLAVAGELIRGKRQDIVPMLRTSRLSSAAMVATEWHAVDPPMEPPSDEGTSYCVELPHIEATLPRAGGCRWALLTLVMRGVSGVRRRAPLCAGVARRAERGRGGGRSLDRGVIRRRDVPSRSGL
ncbi:hypothetical protein AB0K23_11805 [Streptomyces sp. NPDC049602]|uniref:hypothetical protein n=1 Tax=Streptomyces sp. NPDC049602 TaxID=3155504 RepID=UPI003414B7AE